MNPLAHILFGALFASLLLAFGVELPRRRQGLGNSCLGIWRISLVIVLLAGVAAVPQATRYFGDKKLDSGPIFNLFLFHDVLELTSQRFRLGNDLLDPPVILFGLGFGVVMLFLAYLRSEKSEAWDTLLRDVAYFSVIIISLVAIRVVVSSNNYVFLARTNVYVNRQPHMVVEDSVFFGQVPIVGVNRDKALAVRDTYLTINKTTWLGEPPVEVEYFLKGSPFHALEYNTMVSMMTRLRQEPGLLSVEDLDRIIRSGTLPETNMPITLIVGIPLVAFAICTWLIYPGLETDED
jgi:hypothetical protein